MIITVAGKEGTRFIELSKKLERVLECLNLSAIIKKVNEPKECKNLGVRSFPVLVINNKVLLECNDNLSIDELIYAIQKFYFVMNQVQ